MEQMNAKHILLEWCQFRNNQLLRRLSTFFSCLYKFMVVGVTGAIGAIVQRQSMAYKSGPENV